MRVLKQGLVGQDKRISMLTCTRAWGAWFQLVLRLDPLLLGRIVQFKQLIQDNGLIRLKNSIYDWSWKHNVLIKEEKPLLKPSSSKGAHVKTKIVLPWFTKVYFKTGIFERVWPPREGKVLVGGYKLWQLPASRQWTGENRLLATEEPSWVWEITNWSSRLQENYQSF